MCGWVSGWVGSVGVASVEMFAGKFKKSGFGVGKQFLDVVRFCILGLIRFRE